MSKRAIFLLSGMLAALLLLAPAGVRAAPAEQLNGGFENVSNGAPAEWTQDAYVPDAAYSVLTIETGDARTGEHYARISSAQPNDAKWVQTVAVESNSLYKLSGWIRAEGAGDGFAGANLSVIGVTSYSADFKTTNGKWEYAEYYGSTGENQTEATIAVRLGGYGSLNVGTADFDDVALEKIDAAPEGATVYPMEPGPAAAQPQAAKASDGFGPWMFFAALLFVGLFAGVRYVQRTYEVLPFAATASRQATFAAAMLGAAFVLRLALAPQIEGHPIDVNDFGAWALHAYSGGLTGFYGGGLFTDYPPGYVYVLYVIGWLQHATGWDIHSGAFLTLLKLPAMAADIAIAALLYVWTRERAGYVAALGMATLYAMNPGVILNSALWAQVDSVFTLFVLLLVKALTDKKPHRAAAYFAIALLIKPQSLIFAPLVLFALLGADTRKDWRAWARTAAYGLGTFIVLLIPFSLHQSPLWIIDQYRSMFGIYPLASFNAFNLYTLFGANGAPTSQTWLGIPFDVWDIVALLGVVAFAGYLIFKSKHEAKFAYVGMLVALLVFAFKTGMHERYAYPALVLALWSYTMIKDRRILYLFFGLSLVHFANVAYVLRESLDQIYFIPNGDAFMVFVSLANLALTLYAAKLGWDLLLAKKEVRQDDYEKATATPQGKGKTVPGKSPHKAAVSAKKGGSGSAKTVPAIPPVTSETGALALTRKDWAIMGGLTVLYAALAFVRLGSAHAPQTFWQPARQGDSVQVELKADVPIQAIAWYGGLGDGSYNVESSADGQAWTPVAAIAPSGATVFQWQKTQIPFSGRFVKLTVDRPGGALGELAFVSADGASPAEIAKVAPAGGSGDAARLFDEQDVVPAKASYMNSAYFDEIYFARTAYEHLHAKEPYETTHPPLGKVMISAGVAVFGMDPFGWRVLGTLLGVAMVPLMYLFAKRLFGRTEYAAAAAGLLSLDFMHFTQSRIGTVDVFAVFFILLSYYFMYRYFTIDFYKTRLAKTFVPLGLAGLFFGISAACKWIGFYSGAGLAIVLCVSLYSRYKQYEADPKLPFARNTILTLAACLVFFVAIPAAVYVAAYIPFMRVPGPGHGFSNVIDYQRFMFDYHKNLVAQHPFSSSWWQWPFILKPVWYYAGGGLAAGKMSSIVAMGNPAIWWTGIAAVAFSLYYAAKSKDKRMAVILVGLAAQYVPWIGVTRLTFIYHFFASVPFVILCLVYAMKTLNERYGTSRNWNYAFIGFSLFLFLLFYPVLSGATIDQSYAAHYLKWFKEWIFIG